MRRLTLREVQEQYGGILPPDAIFKADDETPPSLSAAKPSSKPSPAKSKRRTRSERFGALNAFVDFGIADADLSPAEALVWLVLYRDTKPNGLARTGQADIARRTRLDVRTVRRAVASLIAKGMLKTVCRGRLNVGPSVYRVRPIAKT